MPILTGINKRNGVKKIIIIILIIIIIKMCDLSLSYSFQIYTATPSVFTHMYRLFVSVSMDYTERRCCEIELFKCTLTSL